MVNPYRSSGEADAPRHRRRGERRYTSLAVFLVPVALVASLPGCFLVNQSMGVIRTSTTVGGFVINGEPVATSLIVACSLGLAGILLATSGGLAALGVRNRRKNNIARNEAAEDASS